MKVRPPLVLGKRTNERDTSNCERGGGRSVGRIPDLGSEGEGQQRSDRQQAWVDASAVQLWSSQPWIPKSLEELRGSKQDRVMDLYVLCFFQLLSQYLFLTQAVGESGLGHPQKGVL